MPDKSAASLALYVKANRCPKCQGEAAACFVPVPGYTTLRYNGEPVGLSHPLFSVTRGEHIKRRCVDCGYQWPEACLDS